MQLNEQDNQNSQSRSFHPLAFALWTIIIVVALSFGIRMFTKRQQIIHAISHLTLQVSHIPLEAAQKPPWTTFIVKPGENLKDLFKRSGLSLNVYHQIIQIKNVSNYFDNLKPKQAFYILKNKNNKLQKFIFHLNKLEYIEVTQKDNKWHAELIKLALQKKIIAIQGVIKKSFIQAADNAHVPKTVAIHLEDVFGWDIDFAKQIKQDDKFKVIYEEYYSNDNKIKPGNILAAELITHNKTYYAIRYKTYRNHIGFYTLKGKNLQKAFLRAPVKYTRVSSPFGARRLHPILHIVRPHEGVDLAAPMGRKIIATCDGKIIFRGRKGGYGKVVIVRHNRHYSTLCAHMSRFAAHEHVGSYVKEGQIIGYVGMTGLATGPHVHYEFRINGIRYDPMKVKLPTAAPIPWKMRKTYLPYAKKMQKELTEI